MNRVICPSGHFYDGDAFDKCPHCAAGVPPVKQDPFAVRQERAADAKTGGKTGEKAGEKTGEKGSEKGGEKKKGFFGRKSRQPEQNPGVAEEPVEKTAVLGGAFLQGQNLVSEENISQEERNVFPPQEQRFSGQAEPASVRREEPVSFRQQEQSVLPGGQKRTSVTGRRTESSLSEEFAAVKRGEDADEGKTVGFFSAGKNVEPPVGYLICTAGEDFGTGFPLKSGNNSLGRSASMDVVIMDAKVSRERQAIVMYEPRRREFYLRPGESSGLCYLGGEVVLETVKLKQFDRIALGDTELMLFPVCCDRFSWDELEEK